MKLFKPKVDLSDVCFQFYDQFILPPPIANVDPPTLYYGGIRDSIIEVDSSFVGVDQAQFIYEMTAIHFELFALACLLEEGEKFTAHQSGFTKLYLSGKKRMDIWETMKEYNQAISRSAYYGLNPDATTRLDKEKVDKFALWQAPGPEFVARAVNRLGTKKSWADGKTRGTILYTLCNRLSCDPTVLSDEARFRLEAVIFGLYDGAKQFLSEVRITT